MDGIAVGKSSCDPLAITKSFSATNLSHGGIIERAQRDEWKRHWKHDATNKVLTTGANSVAPAITH